jgi:hypothetical protein
VVSDVELPADLLEVDEALHELFRRVRFYQCLNPVNGVEAREAYRRGVWIPPFRYEPATWADRELRGLDALRPPLDHPFGVLMAQAIEGIRVLIVALRDRTADAFDALARHNGWYPDAATLVAAQSETYERDLAPSVLGAQAMRQALQRGLRDNGLSGWRVDMDPVMSARVLVDGAKREIKVRPSASFRRRDVRRLIVHEIEVHALRANNGQQQPLKIFSTGLPNSLETEEGLALYAEETAGVASPGTAWRQGVVVQAVHWARDMGFHELHEHIAREAEPGLAWGVALRLKRGLANPEAPGVYAKDVVYYRGVRRVRAWLQAGNPVEHLFVGKVAIHDPVQLWIDQGLVRVHELPLSFRGA